MKISQLRFEKIENYDPFNKRAKGNGMVAKWAARNAVHNICYTVVNSGTYNHVAPGSYVYYDMSPWAIWLVVINIVVWLAVAGIIVWIVIRTLDEKKHPEKYAKRKSYKQ